MISDFIIEHINHGYGSTHFLLLRGRFKLKLFKQHSSCLQGDTNAYLAYRSAFTPSAVTKWFPSLCFLVHITGKLLLKSIVPCACKNKKLNVFKQRKRPSLMDDCSVFTSKPWKKEPPQLKHKTRQIAEVNLKTAVCWSPRAMQENRVLCFGLMSGACEQVRRAVAQAPLSTGGRAFTVCAVGMQQYRGHRSTSVTGFLHSFDILI